jgi:2-alkenal reductase
MLTMLIALLVLAALACTSITSLGEDQPASTTTEDAAIIRAAVATVQAQTNSNNTTIGEQTSIVVDSSLQDTLTDLYDRVNPSVVFILTNVGNATLGSGSGFIFDANGHIVTNNHVVVDGDNFEVVFPDGSRREAGLVGTDVDSDLAVIKVDTLPDSVSPVPLAEFEKVDVGQIVVALGSPFGQQGSMSLGIISGLGRSLESQRDSGLGGNYSLPQVIQTDAPINPGNSGGPLLNLNGEVVGVNSAIRTTTGLNSGVGFAIPVQAVRRIVPALIDSGSYTYPFMGITATGGQLTLAAQEAFDLPQTSGVYVTGVTPDSPADNAGLIPAGSDNRGGDLIVAVDGQVVGEFNDLISYLVFQTEVGQTITLTVLRAEQSLDLPLILGERP